MRDPQPPSMMPKEKCPVCGHERPNWAGKIAVLFFLAVWVAWCIALIALAWKVIT